MTALCYRPSLGFSFHTPSWPGLGTRVMGASMCENLMCAAGFSPTVYNRTKAKAEKLVAWCPAVSPPRAVAEGCRPIPWTVREVILGAVSVPAGCRPGVILVAYDHERAVAGGGDRPRGAYAVPA